MNPLFLKSVEEAAPHSSFAERFAEMEAQGDQTDFLYQP